MGKILISDETNSTYTAQVTNGRRVRIERGAGSHLAIGSAASSSTIVANAAACYLDKIIIGSLPATATTLLLLDTATSGASGAVLDVSGANRIAKITIEPVAVAPTAQTGSYVIPIEVYCTSGLTYALGSTGTDIGNLDDISIIYQT